MAHADTMAGAVMTAPPTRGETASSSWFIRLALGLTAIGIYYLLPQGGAGQATLLTTLNGTAAVWAFRGASKTQGRTRVVWVSLGMAMALATLANGPYYGIPLITGHPTPFPYPGDILWLGTYPCFMVALAALVKQRRRDDRRGDALDATILVVAAGLLMWEYIIAPVVHASGLPLLAHVVAVAYPTMDLVVFALLIRLVVAVAWRNVAMSLVLGSLVSLLLADTLYAHELSTGRYHVGGPTDALWMASYLLIGLAAQHPSARQLARVASRSGHRLSAGKLTFLGVALLTGPALMASRPRELLVIAAASGVSFLLVMARVTSLNRQLSLAGIVLESRATTDSLTGLANRAAFRGALEAVFANSIRPHLNAAVLFVDLDDFKEVNDRLGHAAGDRVLRVCAERLRQVVRPGDIVARLGGDELALLLNPVSDVPAARAVAERVVRALAEPFEVNGSHIYVSGSVGLALRSGDSDPDRLMREADLAMYAAKAGGKSRVVCYDDALASAVCDEHELKTDVTFATARGELVIDYQPMVELTTGRMVGVEALVRWQHPTRGLLQPAAFIGLAEETGAIIDLGEWVLETACRQVRTWQDAYACSGFELSVNVSVRQLERRDFAGRIRDVLSRTGFDPTLLVLEVTESILADPRSEAAGALEALRQTGIRVAIDDFGTGYASIEYLRRLPVDILKVDRSFVSGEHADPQSVLLLEAIIGLGQRLGLDVTPEGIEEAGQLNRLRDLGCRTGQGFLLSRPVAPAVISAMLVHGMPIAPPHRPADADRRGSHNVPTASALAT
jgi:diguanylate cyclase (GGDEF)-like protein